MDNSIINCNVVRRQLFTPTDWKQMCLELLDVFMPSFGECESVLTDMLGEHVNLRSILSIVGVTKV